MATQYVAIIHPVHGGPATVNGPHPTIRAARKGAESHGTLADMAEIRTLRAGGTIGRMVGEHRRDGDRWHAATMPRWGDMGHFDAAGTGDWHDVTDSWCSCRPSWRGGLEGAARDFQAFVDFVSPLLMTGSELRDQRTRAGLSLSALARRMGRDRVTVWRWEGQATVTSKQAAEYLAALVKEQP